MGDSPDQEVSHQNLFLFSPIIECMGLFESIKQSFLGKNSKNIGNIESICPNCGKALEIRPSKKKNCPECGRLIYVRTRPSDKEKVLVTESQAEQIEEQWSIVDGTHEFYLAEKKALEDLKREMIAKLGRVPSDNDVRWHLYNKQNLEAACCGNWGQYRYTRFRMAELLRNENRLKGALPLYLEICYLDLNGAFPEKRILAPEILERISSIVKKLSLIPSDIESEFKSSMKGQYASLDLPFSPDAAWERIESEIFPSAGISESSSRAKFPKDKPGLYKGKHFTEYVEEAKSLVRENRLDDAEKLLLALIDATESDSKYGVAPWYYEKLAIVYRKKKDLKAEIGILERYFAVQKVSVTSSSKLLARLEKLRTRDH